jgi:hypothetical protein
MLKSPGNNKDCRLAIADCQFAASESHARWLIVQAKSQSAIGNRQSAMQYAAD